MKKIMYLLTIVILCYFITACDANSSNVPDGEVIFDKEDVRIIAVEPSYDEEGNWVLELYIENNTKEETYVSLDAGSVNDAMVRLDVETYAACHVPAKSNSTVCISVSKYQLESFGITDVGKFEFTPFITNGYHVNDEPITINYGEYVPVNIEGVNVFQSEMLSVDISDIYISYGGALVEFFARNRTDEDVALNIENVTVNGILTSETSTDYIHRNKSSKLQLFIQEDDLQKYDLTKVEDIEKMGFRFSLYKKSDSGQYDMMMLETEQKSISQIKWIEK